MQTLNVKAKSSIVALYEKRDLNPIFGANAKTAGLKLSFLRQPMNKSSYYSFKIFLRSF